MKQQLSQAQVCEQFGSIFVPPGADQHLGLSLATLDQLPLNALRHPAEHGTCGWYVWGGELSEDPHFFEPLHVLHAVEHIPQLIPYLALAPGWRVLLAPEHVEVWYDPALLAV